VFGWFRRAKSASGPTPEWLERLETVERRLRSIETDWLEFEEKVQRKVWRAAKMRGPDAAPEEPADAPREAHNDDPRLRGLDPVSARIVALRRARVVRG